MTAAIVDPEGPELCVLPTNPAPEGTQAGWVETTDGVRLRYARWPKGGGMARGTVCIAQGRTEFIEKYFETVADFQARGFAVATFDFRGQGGSARALGNSRLGHVECFDDYWTDLQSFHTRVLLPDCPPPYYLVAHSMGGLVGLLASARDRMMFDRVLLSSPMLALDRQPLSMAGMARLCDALCFIGLGTVGAGRRQDRLPTAESFPANPVTSDRRRYLRTVDTWAARPDLAVGVPTIRWAAAAFRAMAAAAGDRFPVTVKIPVLMLAAANDTVVSAQAIESVGLRMRNGRHLIIPKARHELFMENEEVRGQALAAFDAFITEQSG